MEWSHFAADNGYAAHLSWGISASTPEEFHRAPSLTAESAALPDRDLVYVCYWESFQCNAAIKGALKLAERRCVYDNLLVPNALCIPV